MLRKRGVVRTTIGPALVPGVSAMGWYARVPRVRRPVVPQLALLFAFAAIAVTISVGIGIAGTPRSVQPPQLAVSLTGLNAGTSNDRSLCVVFALVPGAASECADLRITHGLPAAMSKGTVQAPTLLYNSAVAHPYPIVRTDVRYTSGTKPDSVEAILKVNGVERRRGMWSGAPMTLNVPRRLALGYDAIPSGSGDATGLYPYTIEVAAFVGGTKGATTTVSDTLVLVNRSGSSMGPGWWLSGLEQLFPQGDGSLLWVGGDGSARRYANAGTNVWVAAALTFPDTIKLASGEYTRFAKHAVKVRFNSVGNHITTMRRLGDSTRFTYADTGGAPRLSSIITLSGQTYSFAYNGSNRLTSVTAPTAAGTTRTTTIAVGGGGTGTITSITDPDTRVVGFGYHATFTRRMITRTDRRSTTTTFSYDNGWKVSQSSLGMGATPDIVDNFAPAETRGLVATSGISTLVDTALAYTRHDGPRSDVGDSTRFFLDLRFGAPQRIIDAVGNTTLLARTSATYPAVVTRVQRANGHVQLAVYNARGNLRVLKDSGGIVAGQIDSTRYEWDDVFDVVQRSVPQLGDSITRSISSTNGNILWQEDRRGSDSRVTFTYDNGGISTGLLTKIAYPGTAVDSFAYDAQGNLRYTRSPLGFVTLIERDNLGRDTLTISPIDATRTFRHRKVFDVVDQVTRDERVGSSTIPYTLAWSGLAVDTSPLRNDTLITTYFYDNEGNRTLTSSTTSAYVTNVGSDESAAYDRANRPISVTTGLGSQTIAYDAAGNDTLQVYASGANVTQTFDALNRLEKRKLPFMDFSRQRCFGFPTGSISDGSVGPGCNMVFPYYPNNGTGYRIPTDSSLFTYDAVGNLLTANNRYARIKRGYTLNGLITRDSLIFGLYSSPTSDSERRGQNYTYDRNGRRASMVWIGGTTSYAYSAAGVPDFGPLQQVTDPGSNTYRLRYDLQSRVDSLVVSTSAGVAGVRERRQYDADSRLMSRQRVSTFGTVGQLNLDSLWYDRRDKVDSVQAYSRAQTSERVRYAYNPHGAVVAQERVRSGGFAYQVQEFRNDAYGNAFYIRTRSSASGDEAPSVADYFNDGLLISRNTILPPPGQITQSMVDEELHQEGDGGRVTLTGRLVAIPPVNGGGWASQMGGRQYYQADEKLSVVQRYDFQVGSSASLGSWEEYWYDALGRRILTRARRSGSPPTGTGPLCNDPVSTRCQSYWQRTLWDGDQILYEWRTADGTTTGLNAGTAGYVHLEGIDQPVGLIRSDGTRVINYNWRGLGESSVFVNGAPGDNSITGGSLAVEWPTKSQGGVYFTPNVLASGPTGNFTWFGTLAANGAGSTGMLYRRNRYFDPVTGRFTQADPIGLSGGLNLYGFANGDPVNFTDPFGLCTHPGDPECAKWVGAGSGIGAGIGLAIAAGCTATTAGICVAGAPAIVGATATLGGAIGGLVGNAATAFSYKPGGRFSPKSKRTIDREATEATGQEGTCEYCGVQTVPTHGSRKSKQFDHLDPAARGGSNDPANGRRSCATCNQGFGSRPKPDPRTPD